MAIVMSLCLVPIIGMAGAAVDYSRAALARTEIQAALDGAVLAGVTTDKLNSKSAAAQDYFRSHPVAANGTATFSATKNSVVGTAAVSVPTALLSVLGIEHLDVTVSATAIKDPLSPCIIVRESVQIGLYVNSDAHLDADCGVHVNSTNKEALYVNSGSTIKAEATCVVGKARVNSGSSITPAAKTGCDPTADPLAHLPEPTEGLSACKFTDLVVNNDETRILWPGTYCKTLTVNSGAKVILQPGIYVFKNTLLKVNSGAALKGHEVLLFFSGKEGRIEIDSDSKFQISAPTSGTYRGLAIF